MSRVKVDYSTYNKAAYHKFLKNHNLTEKDITFKKYVSNIKICNWMYIEYALRTGEKVQLPYGFGQIAVNKRLLKRYKEHNGKTYVNLRVDWASTKKYGKKIYHTNEHTDGFNFKWIWFNKPCKIHLAEIYTFKACRYASRAIAKYLKKNSGNMELYLEWQNNKYK
jgi:hypothetical protein